MSLLSKIQNIPDGPVTPGNGKEYGVKNVFYDGIASILLSVFVVQVGKNVLCQVHCDVWVW